MLKQEDNANHSQDNWLLPRAWDKVSYHHLLFAVAEFETKKKKILNMSWILLA